MKMTEYRPPTKVLSLLGELHNEIYKHPFQRVFYAGIQAREYDKWIWREISSASRKQPNVPKGSKNRVQAAPKKQVLSSGRISAGA